MSTPATHATLDDSSLPDVQTFVGLVPLPQGAARTGRVNIPDVEWHGNRQNCIVNVRAKARLSWFKADNDWRLGLVVTTNGDIHNPHVVQSINVPFSVDILINGVQSDNIAHDLFAPAVLDPRGSDQWYVFTDEADDLQPEDLIDARGITLEINI